MRTRTRMRSVLSLVAFTACTSGCAQTIAFQLVHPARINAAAHGNTFTVADVTASGAPGEGNVAERVGEQLREAIHTDTPNGLRVLDAGGGVLIHAQVTRYAYTEWNSTANFDCSIVSRRTTLSSRLGSGGPTQPLQPLVRGPRERVLDTRVSRGCTTDARNGRLSLTVHFTLTASATGETLSAWDVVESRVHSESAFFPGEPAPSISTDALRDAVARDVVARFVRRLTPWSERAEVAFALCPLFERACNRAYDLARRGRFQDALDALAPVTDRAARIHTVPQEQTEGVAAAMHNRALVELMSGDYAAAQRDLDAANMLQPGMPAWLHTADWVTVLDAEQRGAEDRDPTDESDDRNPVRTERTPPQSESKGESASAPASESASESAGESASEP